MKVLVICNKSEIGYKIIKKLDDINCDFILVTKYKKNIDKLNSEIKNDFKTIVLDIASSYNCEKLYKKVKDENIDVVINCIDIVGPKKFIDEKIDNDLDLIDTNIKGAHTIMKLFLKEFEKNDKGYILNICTDVSNLHITYNAIKSYLSSLTLSIEEELRIKKSHTKVKFLCMNNLNESNKFIDKIIKEII